jgi:hypothetical protein
VLRAGNVVERDDGDLNAFMAAMKANEWRLRFIVSPQISPIHWTLMQDLYTSSIIADRRFPHKEKRAK